MNEPFRHFSVGRFRGFAMVDSVVQLPAAPFFVNAPPDLLDQELRRHGMADGQFNGIVTCLFLDTGAHKIVLDTGYGPGLGPGMGQDVVPPDCGRDRAGGRRYGDPISLACRSRGRRSRRRRGAGVPERPARDGAGRMGLGRVGRGLASDGAHGR